MRIIAVKYCFFVTVFFLLSTFACAEENKPADKDYVPDIELNVIRVIDRDFRDITDKDLKQILDTAKSMYKDKFGFDNVSFKDTGSVEIGKFFSEYLDKSGEVYRSKDKRRFIYGKQNDFEKHKKSILKFIRQWKLEELQGYFPENERAEYDSYEKIYQGLARQMQQKIDYIGSIKLDGKSILDKSKREYRSFLNWLTVLENQNKYDLVLTNTFILYDDISQPSPHSIFSKCKVGGVSHKNNHRLPLDGRVVMGSTFGMDTNIAFFAEEGRAKVDRKERNEVTGAFVVAHELGHALFKLPDHYNHGPECLMNNNKEISYKEGYELLITHKGKCKRCEKWLTAREAFWQAEKFFNEQKWQQAIDKYVFVIKNTPKNVDGLRNKYMAYISYQLSRAYLKVGNRKMAIKGAKMAVKLYRWDKTYAKWLDEVEKAVKGK